MSDVFISYSSKDKEKADQLSELLGSAGLSVWIDQSGLDIASSWSAEIVDAISACSAFIVLLSSNSIESHNVIKEVSLASEKRKKILPLDLEPITLPRELEYQLAGLHRAPMTNINAIIYNWLVIHVKNIGSFCATFGSNYFREKAFFRGRTNLGITIFSMVI